MDALILMTRIPIPGRTKTRLMEVLSGNECAKLHRCFLLDIFNTFKAIKEDVDIYITYTPKDSLGIISKMVPEYITCFPQAGNSLGQRMFNSMEMLFNKGYKKVVLIGSDIPDIKSKDIMEAFELLDSKDIALGPTLDGGYYLIGMKKAYEKLFNESIKWGNKSVFAGTVDIANKSGLKVGLAAKYRDIDDKEDLLSFIEEFKDIKSSEGIIPINTIIYVNKLWSDLKSEKRNNCK